MLHEGRIILDVSGTERANLTIANLLDRFEQIGETDLSDDALLLG
jgi:putative ABC transport system ATP-binding protein